MFRDLAVEKMEVVTYSWVLGIEKVTYLWNIKKIECVELRERQSEKIGGGRGERTIVGSF